MILKDYLKAGYKILANNVSNTVKQFYNVQTIPWLTTDYIDVYERTIKAKYSLREMFVEDESEVEELTELMMLSNYDKYNHIYNLLLMEYNPLWNVDGTETTTRTLTGQNTKSNTGTDSTTYNSKNERTVEDLKTYNTQDERTIEDVTTHNTTDALTGSDSTTYGKTLTESNDDSRTTYDSSTYYGTDTNEKSSTEGGTDRGTKSESTTHTGTDRNDVSDTNEHTGTDRNDVSDTNEHTGTDTTTKTETGTDSQTLSERIVNERQGNIGITSTVHLMTEDIEFSDKYRKFINMVCVDLVREITLSC